MTTSNQRNEDVLRHIKDQLSGRGRTDVFSATDFQRIEVALEDRLPEDVRAVYGSVPLAGTSTRHRVSKGKVELFWYYPEQIIEEVREFIPACIARRCGYMPIAADSLGSGDGFFVQYRGGIERKVVQIFHEMYHDVDRDWKMLEPHTVRTIASSLADLLMDAEVIGVSPDYRETERRRE